MSAYPRPGLAAWAVKYSPKTLSVKNARQTTLNYRPPGTDVESIPTELVNDTLIRDGGVDIFRRFV